MASHNIVHLKDALKSGKFVLTAEITPPVSCDSNDLLEKALPLRGLADAVNVTDGAGARAHMDSLTAATILLQNGIEPILQLTCRDRNRLGLQAALMGAAAVGVRNLLALRGDDPKFGDQPDTKPVFDIDARGLLLTAARMRDAQELPSGKKVGGKPDFFLGAADAPIDPAPDWKPVSLKGKVEAGARFAQTQFCMDAGVLRRYTERLTEEGILPELAMIVGVVPFRSGKSARWIKNKLFGAIVPDAMIERMDTASDPIAEGKAILGDYLLEISEIPGVVGAHIMAPNNDDAVPDVITEFRKRKGK
ncbi:methylenetetrahydrofolate reductase [Pseudorhodoplanes sinuspersici]|nr:methylenetetrahydrofolate reductase [Pseudorhodoplanes sinuspersici]